jgi:hypothetical protein
MKPGDVVFCEDFRFEDGDISDKLFVILAPAPDHKVMLVLTTSQQHRRDLKDGCHPTTNESYFTFNANRAVFDTTTWIVLTPRIMYERGFQLKIDDERAKIIGTLKDADFRAIVNCLKKSEDVSPFHLSLLT